MSKGFKTIQINSHGLDGEVSSLERFGVPKIYRPFLKSVLIPERQILDQVNSLANHLWNEYCGKEILLYTVLTGASMFSQALSYQLIQLNETKATESKPGVVLTYGEVRASSYAGTQSTGNVEISGNLSRVKNKQVLVIEDIVDTGETMVHLTAAIREQGSLSVKVVSLLHKKTTRSNGYVPDYACFSVHDAFVVGYGLDCNDYFRDMRHICVADEGKIVNFRK